MRCPQMLWERTAGSWTNVGEGVFSANHYILCACFSVLHAFYDGMRQEVYSKGNEMHKEMSDL